MKTRRWILILLATIGMGSFFLSFPFFYALERNSPSAPIVQRNYQLSDHGHDFYVTREQYWVFEILVYGGWSLFVVAALLNYRWKVIRNLTPRGWEFPK